MTRDALCAAPADNRHVDRSRWSRDADSVSVSERLAEEILIGGLSALLVANYR